jgi:hypothetical protein
MSGRTNYKGNKIGCVPLRRLTSIIDGLAAFQAVLGGAGRERYL